MVARLGLFFGGLAYDGLVRQDSPQRVRYRAAQLRSAAHCGYVAMSLPACASAQVSRGLQRPCSCYHLLPSSQSAPSCKMT